MLANMASCTSVTILQKDTEARLGRCWGEEKVLHQWVVGEEAFSKG